MELIHGGDIYGFTERHGGRLPLDLSANINPWGMPNEVRQAMHGAIADCVHYPDPLCRELRRAIAKMNGIDADWIFCGNGAAEILFRLAAVLKPKSALITAPTFAEYEQSLRGASVSFHTLLEEENFIVTPRILRQMTSDIDVVYLCNPNNPTGGTIDCELLLQILEHCEKYDIYLIVDECFIDFLEDAQTHILTRYLASYPKLILLRAFTKMYAVPGIRLGYCMCTDKKLLDGLREVGQPWNVSVVAQACGLAASNLVDFAKATAERIATERKFLQKELCNRGIRVYPAQANFLLWKTKDTKIHEKLAQKGILIRNCSNYRGLSAGHYRIAVKTHEDSIHFLQTLDVCLAER